MSEKFNARELAFNYPARTPGKMSEDEYLQKLVSAEARFTELLAPANPPAPEHPLGSWQHHEKLI